MERVMEMNMKAVLKLLPTANQNQYRVNSIGKIVPKTRPNPGAAIQDEDDEDTPFIPDATDRNTRRGRGHRGGNRGNRGRGAAAVRGTSA
jgi:hypothetical protein